MWQSRYKWRRSTVDMEALQGSAKRSCDAAVCPLWRIVYDTRTEPVTQHSAERPDTPRSDLHTFHMTHLVSLTCFHRKEDDHFTSKHLLELHFQSSDSIHSLRCSRREREGQVFANFKFHYAGIIWLMWTLHSIVMQGSTDEASWVTPPAAGVEVLLFCRFIVIKFVPSQIKAVKTITSVSCFFNLQSHNSTHVMCVNQPNKWG